jgi:ABC-type proline/glycine betaine transport system ATPase subunit
MDDNDAYDSLFFHTLYNYLTNTKKRVCLLIGKSGFGKTTALKYFIEY